MRHMAINESLNGCADCMRVMDEIMAETDIIGGLGIMDKNGFIKRKEENDD